MPRQKSNIRLELKCPVLSFKVWNPPSEAIQRNLIKHGIKQEFTGGIRRPIRKSQNRKVYRAALEVRSESDFWEASPC